MSMWNFLPDGTTKYPGYNKVKRGAGAEEKVEEIPSYLSAGIANLQLVKPLKLLL